MVLPLSAAERDTLVETVAAAASARRVAFGQRDHRGGEAFKIDRHVNENVLGQGEQAFLMLAREGIP